MFGFLNTSRYSTLKIAWWMYECGFYRAAHERARVCTVCCVWSSRLILGFSDSNDYTVLLFYGLLYQSEQRHSTVTVHLFLLKDRVTTLSHLCFSTLTCVVGLFFFFLLSSSHQNWVTLNQNSWPLSFLCLKQLFSTWWRLTPDQTFSVNVSVRPQSAAVPLCFCVSLSVLSVRRCVCVCWSVSKGRISWVPWHNQAKRIVR